MGRFETYVDILLHGSIRVCLGYCHVIVPKYYNDFLEWYTNNLILKFIDQEVQYFINSQRVIDLWMISAAEILCTYHLCDVSKKYLYMLVSIKDINSTYIVKTMYFRKWNSTK